MILKIQEGNVELLDNEKIKKAFYSFFNLYKKQEFSLEKTDEYLNRQDLPKLSVTENNTE